MGQKVNPTSLRLGIIRSWDSKWFAAGKKYKDLLHDDLKLKQYIRKKLKNGAITKVEVERFANKIVVNVHAGKPGLIIGRQGVAIEDLKDDLRKKFGQNIDVNIIEVSDPDLSAELIGQMVVSQIERRINYRRAAKMAVQKAMEAGAKGVKIQVSGRLNGVEIARSEQFKEGNIPLHTLRADIDYSKVRANTTYGVIGIKVWVYRGLVFKRKMQQTLSAADKK